MNNIFILGPVASGKNTFLEKISSNYEAITLDTGRIFRFIGYKLYEELKNEIDFNEIDSNDNDTLEMVSNRIYHLNNYISSSLNSLNLVGDKLYIGNEEVEITKLYSRETNAILPIIAKQQMIRDKVLRFIDDYLMRTDKPIIMTGHNIREIDTTKFTVVYLDVDQKESAARLYNRNTSSYKDVLDAYDEVLKRNYIDGINKTKKILPYLYNFIYIDTSGKSIDEVYEEFLIEYKNREEAKNKFLHKQTESIKRDNFNWLLNPILEPIRKLLSEVTLPIEIQFPFINQNDLIYQTLILISSHEITELYHYSNGDYLKCFSEELNGRNEEIIAKFKEKIENGEIELDYALVFKELNAALSFLLDLYSSEEVREIMEKYNAKGEKKELKFHNGLINGADDSNNENIEIKVIDAEMSSFISKYCHYLHTPRTDEFIAYGAFKENDKYPIAYVSYSKQDRDYKKQLLYNIGIEPQNSIEMTRAWCSNSAPTNIMSYLFQYSINDISKKWKGLNENNLTDKNLQAVTTAINPNLGFKASSFLGCNFIPIAMRPAKFTYVEKNGKIKYETRRSIESTSEEEKYFENRISILPLNELILCLDRKKVELVKSSNILLIDKNKYDTVLKDKCLVKKISN